MSDIFISYKREDRPKAKQLADALEGEGWTVWWDPKLRAGEYFDDAIEKALNDARCVIVLWSNLSVKSEYVKTEASEALEKEKLIPLIVENDVKLPLRFKRLQIGSLVGWDGSREFLEFRKVVEDITVKVGPPATRGEEGVSPFEKFALSEQAMLELERMTKDGGELQEDVVVLASIVPLESGCAASLQQSNNIADGVRYVYLWPGREDSAPRALQFLQLLLLAPFLESEQKAEVFQYRHAQVRNNQARILEVLSKICSRGSMRICFLQQLPYPEFAILNATSVYHAALYFKRREGYIKWASGSQAYDFWRTVRTNQGLNAPTPQNAVFYGTPGFQLENGRFLKALTREAEKYFPGFGDIIMKLCLEGPPA